MRVVVALGGNALLERAERPDAEIQEGHVLPAVDALAPIARDHELVVTHGNGPQVGLLAAESEKDPDLEHPYPFDVLGAQTQGLIGYWLLRRPTMSSRQARNETESNGKEQTMDGPAAGAADALAFFGATGDLAHKMIFPALYQMVKHGTLGVPVIGVAFSGWDVEQLRRRARESVERTPAGVDDTGALDRLLSLLRYVDGDYEDPATVDQLRRLLGEARHPAHYLAVPPSMFATVIEGLRAGGLTDGARVIVEKPFGRDLASARALNAVLRSAFDEQEIFRIDHFLGKEEIMNLLYFRFANSFSWSRCGTATTSPASRSPWPRSSGWRAEAPSTSAWAACATSSRTTCSRSSRCSRWSRPPTRESRLSRPAS